MVPLLDALLGLLGRDLDRFRAGFARIVNAPKRPLRVQNDASGHFPMQSRGAAPRLRLDMARKRQTRTSRARQPATTTTSVRRWSDRVTRQSNALDLEEGVFTATDPRTIARSLKRSAERSTRRKADPYRSALSMLVFYINRAGKNLSARQKHVLQRAKSELRKQFGRD